MLSAKSNTPSSCFYSRLLPDLFDLKQLEDGLTITVADFGPANGDTITFLSQFNCRFYVLDIRHVVDSINAKLATQEDLPDETIAEDFRQALNLGSNCQFDVCLFWDLFNYLTPRSLGVFAQVLLPHLSERFRGHGFAALNKGAVLTEQNYGIVNNELMSISSQAKTSVPHRHSQSVINNATTGMAIR